MDKGSSWDERLNFGGLNYIHDFTSETRWKMLLFTRRRESGSRQQRHFACIS